MKFSLSLLTLALVASTAFAQNDIQVVELPEQAPVVTVDLTQPTVPEEAPISAMRAPDVPPYRKHSTEKHQMRIINSGMGSLYARVDMIRRAEKSIDLESYIFNDDKAGKIILKELAAAAQRGVKVRLLVDNFFGVFKMDEFYAQELKKKGIDVRYYNTYPLVALSTFQSRNHRKLMVTDGKEAITGGRNIADEYFDLSEKYNFLDRDVTVEGEIVKTMDESFEKYWNSDMTKEPGPPREPRESDYTDNDFQYRIDRDRYRAKLAKAAKLLDADPEHDRILKFMEEEGKQMFLSHEKRDCPEVAFATDKEAGGFVARLRRGNYDQEYRHLRREIMSWMDQKAKDEVIFDTPYFLANTVSDKISQFLKETRTKITVMTNSLASSDAVPVVTVFSDHVTNYTTYPDFKAYVYKGNYNNETKLIDDKVKNSTWGTHSKTTVFSDESFMIGSFNMDNRSSYYNSELAVFCSGSKELTKDVRNNIEERMGNSHKLDSNGDMEVCEDEALSISPLKKALYWLLKVPSHLMQHLL
ncbi:phospholipase D-like domain-containing protein [Peredibacter sp. HCB2-198]|uniref:phospholipase D-like domain-containing protein n=1 Tax=Peredibacter sp. HCB2-198 TaxID=3383025 RepID=UPI0038B47FAC